MPLAQTTLATPEMRGKAAYRRYRSTRQHLSSLFFENLHESGHIFHMRLTKHFQFKDVCLTVLSGLAMTQVRCYISKFLGKESRKPMTVGCTKFGNFDQYELH